MASSFLDFISKGKKKDSVEIGSMLHRNTSRRVVGVGECAFDTHLSYIHSSRHELSSAFHVHILMIAYSVYKYVVAKLNILLI